MEKKASPAIASPEQSEQSEQPNLCYCGCGETVATRSYYRPGHDSRHVGIVARQVAASTQWDQITRSLPTKALQLKAWNMAYRLHTQAQKQAARQIRRLAH